MTDEERLKRCERIVFVRKGVPSSVAGIGLRYCPQAKQRFRVSSWQGECGWDTYEEAEAHVDRKLTRERKI